MKIINEMLNDGYKVSGVSIRDEFFAGVDIRFLDVLKDHICVELYDGSIVFAPLSSVDYIRIEGDDEE